jgi:uncharacterized protein (TIGR02391 family)
MSSVTFAPLAPPVLRRLSDDEILYGQELLSCLAFDRAPLLPEKLLMHHLGARGIYETPNIVLVQSLARRGLVEFRDQRRPDEPKLYGITPPGRKAQRLGLGLYLNHEREIEGASLPSRFNWQLIHDETRRVSESLFRSGHYAEAVVAATKQINAIVKAKYFMATGKEDDGASLMSKAFGLDSITMQSFIRINDLSSESKRNAQLGYMHLCMGVMKAFRNPLAHENLAMMEEEAWEIINICRVVRRTCGQLEAC